MRELFSSELAYLKKLSLRERAIVMYFTFSFCTLCVTDDSNVLFIAMILINFINAARLIRTVPLPPDDEGTRYKKD